MNFLQDLTLTAHVWQQHDKSNFASKYLEPSRK